MTRNRPSTQELVEAVREMLEDQLLPELQNKAMVYNCRVAVNILKIVERELQQIDSLTRTETESLQNLLSARGDIGPLNELLIEKIGQGEFNGDNQELLAHFQRVVLGRIAIDNPNYSTYKHYLESGELTHY